MKFYWGPKEQSTKRHPVNIYYPNKNECSTLERYGRVRIENPPSVSVFYRENTLWVLVLVRVIKSLVISFIRIRNRTHILLPRLNTGSNV